MASIFLTFDIDALGSSYGVPAWTILWTIAKPSEFRPGDRFTCGDVLPYCVEYAIGITSNSSENLRAIEQRVAASESYQGVAGKHGILRGGPIPNLVTGGFIDGNGRYVKSEESDSGSIALRKVETAT